MQIPSSVIQSRSLDIRISAVYLERELYDNYPPFQRDKVWNEKMKRGLIDSVLRGFYIPAILVTPNPQGGYWVIDGQQRLTSIFEFIEGGFRTGSSDYENESGYIPLETRRLYDQLTPEAQARFKAYPLRFLVLDNIEENMLGVMFRRLQNQVPLTTAEKLWSYTSEATKCAIELSTHPLFNEFYAGRKRRKEPFQMSLYPLFVEIAQGYVDLDSSRLRLLCAGKKDQFVSISLQEQVRRRLDLVLHLFHGSTVTVMTEVIMFYQAVLFLEKAGYDLASSQQGCLVEWHNKMRQENMLDRKTPGVLNLFVQMSRFGFQKQFWARELPSFVSVKGLQATNKAHVFMELDRIVAYTKQNFICLECNKSIRFVDLDKHVFKESDRVSRTLQTCYHVAREQQQTPLLATVS